MENLDLEKFNPTKTELTTLADKYKGLEIKGPNDKEGYQAVKAARLDLKKFRVAIEKTGKELRADALIFQKKVIEREKELVSIIEPIEDQLSAKEKAADEAAEKEKRKALLPDRIAKLKEFEAEFTEDQLLAMDDNEFANFVNDAKSKFLEEKEQKIREDQEKKEADIRAAQEKLAEDQRKLDEEKRIEAARKESEREAGEKARRDAETAAIKAEQDKQAAIEAEQKKAAAEKQALIDEQNRKEQERLEEERKAKEVEEARIAAEKEESEKLAKKKKYKEFLKKNGYSDAKKADFHIEVRTIGKGAKITLFKKVDSIII